MSEALWTCCGWKFADLGALERHQSNGHLPPVDLHLKFSLNGWASR